MKKTDQEISRRQFVSSAFSTAVISCLPAQLLNSAIAAQEGASSEATSSAITPAWKDQGVENLTKSPYAKLRNIPVRAVTIREGLWSPRRKIHGTRRMPTVNAPLATDGRKSSV